MLRRPARATRHTWSNVGPVKREGCRLALSLVPLVSSSSCAGQAALPSAPAAPATGGAAASVAVAATPDIEIRESNAASGRTPPNVERSGRYETIVHGARVAFDGLAEGLAWPALEKAVGRRHAGDVVTIQMARGAPIEDLLRAAWTVRAADVHVQSPDGAGVLRAVELRARREGGSPIAGCHLAVFVRPDGSLRIAAPGGPREVNGDDPPAILARSLEEERAKCPIAYVAFGAESEAAPWGPVFDVVVAVDKAKSAGDARYVLGQAMHAK